MQLSLMVLLAFPAMAQQPADESAARAKEREVKTSGDYLYGESVANTKAEAIRLAKSILVSEINREILTRKDWKYPKQISANDVEYAVESVDLARGSKIRAIAYVRKDGIEAIFDKGKAPVESLTDKKESTQKTPQEPAQVFTVIDPTSEPKKEEKPVQTPPVSTNNPVLDEILRCKTANAASDVFENYRKKEKLRYGRSGTNLTDENSYLMIYNQAGEIVAFLDKGQGSTRKNLLTGEQVSAHSFNAFQIWFQIFE